jgi:Ca-activated chloride channel family protein
MRDFNTQLKRMLATGRIQAVMFAGLVAMTVLWVIWHTPWGTWLRSGPNLAHAKPPKAVSTSDITIHAELSQTKLVQGQNGAVYVNLGIQAPAPVDAMRTGTQPVERLPIDMVVVLDRSPSMLAANKWPYAKTAVLALLQRLGPTDRIGLIGFDHAANVYAELTEVTPQARQHLQNLVQRMQVGSATNIGAGLERGGAMLTQQPSERVKKMILLSDGETNTGITDPQALVKMASEISNRQVVLSTIGMGLGFNEALMAALADHGMGHYAYLERLDALGDILARDLEQTRSLYAERSELDVQLRAGVKLVDAAGYPIEPAVRAVNRFRIKTGQLFWGALKPLMLTLKVPTTAIGDFALGDIALHIHTGGAEKKTVVRHAQLAYSVVVPAKKPEAVASIRRDVYRRSWLQNNLGRMRKEVAGWIKAGDRPKAQAAINAYRRQLDDAEAKSGVRMKDEKVEQDIVQMETELNEAFQGSDAEQGEKQNRLAKRMQYKSREEQRQ